MNKVEFIYNSDLNKYWHKDIKEKYSTKVKSINKKTINIQISVDHFDSKKISILFTDRFEAIGFAVLRPSIDKKRIIKMLNNRRYCFSIKKFFRQINDLCDELRIQRTVNGKYISINLKEQNGIQSKYRNLPCDDI